MKRNLNTSQLRFCKKQKKRARRCLLQYKRHTPKCKQCHKKIPFIHRTNIFCSHSCAAKFNGVGRRRYRKNPNGTIMDYDYCLGCGNKLNKYNVKFCSFLCYKNFEFKKIVNYIEKTGKLPTNKYGDTERGKKYLIKIHGHKCHLCQRTKWRKKPIPLVFDHIDGNHSNWKVENCRLICPNCDHQQPTFAGRNSKNKNNSFKSLRRKKRYIYKKRSHVIWVKVILLGNLL